MVDAADLKSAGCKTVGVQVPLPPSLKTPAATGFSQCSDGRGGFGVWHDLGTKKSKMAKPGTVLDTVAMPPRDPYLNCVNRALKQLCQATANKALLHVFAVA